MGYIKLPNKYIIAVHKVNKSGQDKIFVEIGVVVF